MPSLHVNRVPTLTQKTSTELTTLQAGPNALSQRGFTIASYALCGFANLGSLGIQVGVLSALAPSRAKSIARLGPSAMISGFISTLQTAGIAYVTRPFHHSLFFTPFFLIFPALPFLFFFCLSFSLVGVSAAAYLSPRLVIRYLPIVPTFSQTSNDAISSSL